jgi:predicted nucleic acid-binding protein
VITFVDTNILLDIVGADPVWLAWSARQLEACVQQGDVRIGAIVYAEGATRFALRRDWDEVLERLALGFDPELSRPALYAAAQAHARCRAEGGSRNQILPDFLIGAQAALTGATLLTRDAARFRTYFPMLQLIAPDTHP